MLSVLQHNVCFFTKLRPIHVNLNNKQTGPPVTCDRDLSLESLGTAVSIPENLPLSDVEKSVLSKGLNFVPITKILDEYSVKKDVEKFLRSVQLKAFLRP